MKTGLNGRIGQRAAAGLLGLTIALTALPHAALAGFNPSADQAAHILKTESSLAAQVLVSTEMQGYGSQAIATAANAAKTAMHACMTAGYAKGLDAAGVNALCGPIIDAYLVAPKGDTVVPMTMGMEDVARGKVTSTTVSLTMKIGPDNAAAVGYTVGVCAKAHLRRNYDYEAVGANCYPIVKPFAGLPDITEADSPFSEGPPIVKASTAPQAPAEPTALQTPPEPEEGEGWAGNSEQQVKVGQDGPTQLEVSEQNLNAGQNNNNGNSRNRTGSDDGKKDKDKQNNNSSNNGSSNNSTIDRQIMFCNPAAFHQETGRPNFPEGFLKIYSNSGGGMTHPGK